MDALLAHSLRFVSLHIYNVFLQLYLFQSFYLSIYYKWVDLSIKVLPPQQTTSISLSFRGVLLFYHSACEAFSLWKT